MMKHYLYIILAGTLILVGNSCKKGCTDPLAHNYQKKKTKDNGSCEIYSSVKLTSVTVASFTEHNYASVIWDGGYGDDMDDDNTLPDLFLSFKADGGSFYEPTSFFPSVSATETNVTKTIPTLSISDWQTGSFWVFFYEVDLGGSHLEFIDSVEVNPYVSSDEDRFKDTLVVTKGDIQFTANMQWQ
jgi:hypothetical protein